MVGEGVEKRRRAVTSTKRGELWQLGEERMKKGEQEKSCTQMLTSCRDVAGEVESRTVDGPPGRHDTANPLACVPPTRLMMGEDSAFGGRGPMRTDTANAVMDVDKGPPAPTMSNLEARAESSSLAPSQFTVPVVMGSHHKNH